MVYRRDAIASGAQQILQLSDADDGRFVGDPAWSPVSGDLYVAVPSDPPRGPYRHGLVALHAGPDCQLALNCS
jgi:hypothetical protein